MNYNATKKVKHEWQVWIHIKPVSPRLPTGQVAYGFYTLVDDVITMTNQKGESHMTTPARSTQRSLTARTLRSLPDG